MNATATNPRTNLFRALQMLGGAIAGGIFSYSLVTGLRHLGLNFKALPVVDLVAFMLGVSFLMIGLIILVISFSAAWAGIQLEQRPDAPPATRREMSLFRLQALVMILAGLLIGSPVLAQMTGVAQTSGALVFAGIALAFILQSALNHLIWHRADEFIRALIAKTSIVCFWALQGALFLVASAEKLDLLPPTSLWTACVTMLAFYFIASTVLAARCARR